MINTIIFDLDGTLLNTLEDLKDSTNFALSKYGYPQKTLEEVRTFVGNGVKKLIERAIPDGEKNPDFQECLKTFKDHYSKNMYNKTKPYEGILQVLKILEQNNIKIAVVSNKFDAAVKELCKNYFEKSVHIAIGESQNVRKKPAPDSVFEAIKILGSNAENTLYVGDSEVDAQTAKNAGLKCVGVCWGFRNRDILEKEGVDHIISVPHELLNIIKNHNEKKDE